VKGATNSSNDSDLSPLDRPWAAACLRKARVRELLCPGPHNVLRKSRGCRFTTVRAFRLRNLRNGQIGWAAREPLSGETNAFATLATDKRASGVSPSSSLSSLSLSFSLSLAAVRVYRMTKNLVGSSKAINSQSVPHGCGRRVCCDVIFLLLGHTLSLEASLVTS